MTALPVTEAPAVEVDELELPDDWLMLSDPDIS